MGRTAVRRMEPHRTRRTLDGMVVAGIAVVVLFALVGVVSAGVFVAGKVSSSSSSPPKLHVGSGPSLALQDVRRAHAQATAIVAAAQASSQNVVKSATKNARSRAAAIIANADRQAKSIISRAQAAAPTPVAQQPVTTTGTGTGAATGTGSTTPYTGTTTGSTTGTPYTYPTPSGSTTGTGTTPNLQGVPAAWKVVAYGATFGTGPGNAGGVSVINRGTRTLTGVATVKYTRGGFATASFSIAPGQSAVVPLSGRSYSGGGYAISVSGVH